MALSDNLNAIGELVARYGYEIVAKYLVASRNGFVDGNLVRKVDHGDLVAVKEEVDLEKEVDGLTDETLGLQFGIIHTMVNSVGVWQTLETLRSALEGIADSRSDKPYEWRHRYSLAKVAVYEASEKVLAIFGKEDDKG